mmetsp:Transcript_56449/g.92823  ORF Transcript_56449/g.92823 Transcript_56449/m.92823 type:complete len:125 (+) Transcript_56449:129-503(+)
MHSRSLRVHGTPATHACPHWGQAVLRSTPPGLWFAGASSRQCLQGEHPRVLHHSSLQHHGRPVKYVHLVLDHGPSLSPYRVNYIPHRFCEHCSANVQQSIHSDNCTRARLLYGGSTGEASRCQE